MPWDFLPSWPTYACTFLVWAIPYAIYKINGKLHKAGDPPWKSRQGQTSDSGSQEEKGAAPSPASFNPILWRGKKP